jgi:chromosome segregation ATPase
LSSDIELNHGPSNHTKQILDAIKKSNDIIENVRNEVVAVRSDIGELQNQIFGKKSKVEAIETNENSLEARLTQLETHNVLQNGS